MLNVWLTAFDQIMVLVPYLVAAPLLFADIPEKRITLGTLVKPSNSFDKVFGSLNVVADNWAAVNEWRSVLRRLRSLRRSSAPAAPPPPAPNIRNVTHVSSRLHVEAMASVEVAPEECELGTSASVSNVSSIVQSPPRF